jgi:hypothetical protein
MDVLAHLHSRSLNPDRYQTSVFWDDSVANFYLWNLSGQLVGYQQYRPDGNKKECNDRDLGKYYTYNKDNLAVWGLETLKYRSDILFITEGVFDAVKFHALNLPAIAVLANNPKSLRPWLFSLPRVTIAACDDDDAGRKLANSCQYAFSPGDGRDFGDISVEETRTLVAQKFPWISLDK